MSNGQLFDTWTIAYDDLRDRPEFPALRPDAAEAITDTAAERWVDDYGSPPQNATELCWLSSYVGEALAQYLAPLVRSDGSAIGPCISRDCELGYDISPVNLAHEAVVDGRHRYELWVYEDGSSTLMCTTADGTYWLWDYAYAPGEPITAYDGAPRHILERFEELRQQALAKQQEENHA